MKNQVIILAGGKGTRMKSDIPKVLHTINGDSFINHVIKSVEDVSDKPAIIIGYKGEDIIKHLRDKYEFIWQNEQLGTGHAVLCAKDKLEKMGFDNIVVLPGDHPCISKKTIDDLIDSHINNNAKLTITTVKVPNYENIFSHFYNCGRIVRNKEGLITDIIELKDCNSGEQEIKEVNISYYCFDADWLWGNITKLSNNNKANEYYLTDLINIAKKQNQKINSIGLTDPREGMGVNSKEQLDNINRM